jgi:hypothetical protein
MTARLMRACRALAAALLVAPASAARAADQAEPALTADAAEPRKAAGDSLLFSHRAERLIEEARLGHGRTPAVAATSRGVRGPPAAAPPAVIHLSSIVYHAPDDWRVWLNGRATRRRRSPVRSRSSRSPPTPCGSPGVAARSSARGRSSCSRTKAT